MEIRKAYINYGRVTLDLQAPDPLTGEIIPSMTKQSFADETDINQIMARFEKTGVIDHVKDHGGYHDMPAGLEYQQAMQLSIEAQMAFDDLPAKIRREFDNDPFKFLEFIENPENVERMAELGLLNDPPEPPKDEAEPPAAAEDPPAPGAAD